MSSVFPFRSNLNNRKMRLEFFMLRLHRDCTMVVKTKAMICGKVSILHVIAESDYQQCTPLSACLF